MGIKNAPIRIDCVVSLDKINISQNVLLRTRNKTRIP